MNIVYIYLEGEANGWVILEHSGHKDSIDIICWLWGPQKRIRGNKKAIRTTQENKWVEDKRHDSVSASIRSKGENLIKQKLWFSSFTNFIYLSIFIFIFPNFMHVLETPLVVGRQHTARTEWEEMHNYMQLFTGRTSWRLGRHKLSYFELSNFAHHSVSSTDT